VPIGPDWAEDAVLDDGTRVRLRAVRPDDKELLARAFGKLSAETRYRRFFSAKDRLSEAELKYLTEVDGRDHLAIGATCDGEGVGIARFVRLRDRPDVAEAAIVVVDDKQGRGLGRLLLARLAQAARERGVTRFRSDVLSRNQAARSLLLEHAPDAEVVSSTGDAVTIEVPLPELPPDQPKREGPFRLLSLFARRLFD